MGLFLFHYFGRHCLSLCSTSVVLLRVMKVDIPRGFQIKRKWLRKGSFTNYVDKILAFFDHLPPCVDIFYGINVDKKLKFLDCAPTYLVL